MPTHRLDPPELRERAVVPPAPVANSTAIAVGDETIAELEIPPEWNTRAGSRTMRAKFASGLNGLKHAFRGDSSFFAHSYRGLLIALAAALLGVDPRGWCFLLLSAGLVFIAELAHSAIETLAKAGGVAETAESVAAREIATAAVLVAVVLFATVSVVVLVLRLNDLLVWW